MNKLVIDEQYMSELCNVVKKFILKIASDIRTLENKSEDVFTRYMAMIRLNSLTKATQFAYEMARHLTILGFDIHHPFFQTEQAKECEWDTIKIEDNPFFVQLEEGKRTETEAPEELKEMIIEALKSKILNEDKGEVH